MDTYRLWETLSMGALPVLEHTPSRGWDSVLDDLPVLWVHHYDNVTPALLRRAERLLIDVPCNAYNWNKLCASYWTAKIEQTLAHTPLAG